MARRTRAGYINYLPVIRQKLSQYFELVQGGELHYFTDLALQLRIMYLVKSRRNGLLSTILKQEKLEMNVYVTWNTKEMIEHGLIPASLAEGLVMEIINSPVTWFESGHELIDIFDAIHKPEQISQNNNNFSIADIISVYADKMGGAHLDQTVKDADLKLHDPSLKIGGLTIADRVILDTARSTLVLINMLLSYFSSGQTSKFIKSSL